MNNQKNSEEKVKIYIMGKLYQVPKGLTIMKAIEYSGYVYIRGAGCRSGFCGACATIYRKEGDFRLRAGLACQTVVEDGMYLTQIPFVPAQIALYNIDDLEPTAEQILTLYPELYRCLSCNVCKKICPQEIEVMEFIQAALRGGIAKTADLSFDCVMCGLCASRCPAEMVQYNIALLCRRLYGKYLAPKSNQLEKRIAEIESGKFDSELKELTETPDNELRRRYQEREIEK